MHFRGDAQGVHLVGEWDHEAEFSPYLLGEAATYGLTRTTIKVRTVESWAVYRVVGFGTGGTLRAKRIRSGASRMPEVNSQLFGSSAA